jgi:hypothetical protein
MSLRKRVERLERAARRDAIRARTSCPECGGAGRLAMIIGRDEPEPPGCPCCGRVRVIRIVDVDPPGPEQETG